MKKVLLFALALAITATAAVPKAAATDPWLGYPNVFVYIQVVDKDELPVADAAVSYSFDSTVGDCNDTDAYGWTNDVQNYQSKVTYTARKNGKKGVYTGTIGVIMEPPSEYTMGSAFIQITLDMDDECPAALSEDEMPAILDERYDAWEGDRGLCFYEPYLSMGL